MTAASVPETIRTGRLLLRAWQRDDVDDVLAFATDEAWARFLPAPQPYLREHAETFIARRVALDRGRHAAWAICVDGRAVGGADLLFHPHRHAATLGWSLARRLWGRGLATEASRAIIDATFSAYASLNRIEATADLRNAASHRVLEKSGMTREGVLRQYRLARGVPVDVVYYSLLRAEWAGEREAG